MRRKVTLKFEGESRTRQSFKDECDINFMLSNYQRTGQPMNQNFHQANYGDFSNIPTFHEAQTQVVEAQQSFDALPSEIRSRFANDPGQLLDFLQDEDNRAEAIEIGLIDPEARPDPDSPVEPSPGPTNPPAEPGSNTPTG